MTRKSMMKSMLLPILAASVMTSGVVPVAAEAAQRHRSQTTVIEKTRIVKAVSIREHTVVRRTAVRPSRPTRVYDRQPRGRTRTVIVREPVIVRQPVIVREIVYVPAPAPVRPLYRHRVVARPVYRSPPSYEAPLDYSGYARSRAVNHYHRDADFISDAGNVSLMSWLNNLW